jgi:hypothetical protein
MELVRQKAHLMQRTEDGMIVISCDFTGEDWDEVQPMIEGHQGSIISLKALDLAIDHACEQAEKFTCTMCLRHFAAGERAWKPDPLPAGANPRAIICWDCVRQADRSFARDEDTEWDRKIAPDDRWS